MSDHDFDFATDYSMDSDPPRHHPLFAAMDCITALVATASTNATSPQSSQPSRPSKDADTTTVQPQADAAAHKKAQLKVMEEEMEEAKGWPFLPLRDFTIYTINAIKNGEMEDEAEKTSMSDKHKAYCDDYELMKPVLNLLANSDQKIQDIVHKMVHTMLDNLATGYRMKHSISDITCDISLLRKDFGNLRFHCLNCPSPVRRPPSAAIVKCLADNVRLAHFLLSKLDASENQNNIFKHVKHIMAIAKKESNGEKLTQEEKDLNERYGDKPMSELEDEVGFKQTPDLERFVIHVAAFAKLCVDEAERQTGAQKEKGVGEEDDKKGEEGSEKEEQDDGDSNSTIKAI